jgi:hypothetical protein
MFKETKQNKNKKWRNISKDEFFRLIKNSTCKKDMFSYLELPKNGPYANAVVDHLIDNFNADVSHFNKKVLIKSCKRCGKKFKGIPSEIKKRSYCSRSCGSKREMSQKTKDKISNILKTKYPKKLKSCKKCGSVVSKHTDICKKNIFKTLALYFGFDERVIGTEDIYKEYFRIRDAIEQDYYENEMSCTTMGEKYIPNFDKKNSSNFRKILVSIGLQLRTRVEASHLMFKHNRDNITYTNNMYQNGWHITWNGKRVFYRSSYEREYCDILDYNKIDYNMENLRIEYWDTQKLSYRIAIPDFHLIESNEIVEIKSNWTFDEQNMRDRFKEYRKLGYTPKLILEKVEFDI